MAGGRTTVAGSAGGRVSEGSVPPSTRTAASRTGWSCSMAIARTLPVEAAAHVRSVHLEPDDLAAGHLVDPPRLGHGLHQGEAAAGGGPVVAGPLGGGHERVPI